MARMPELEVKLDQEPFKILERHFGAYAKVIEAAKVWHESGSEYDAAEALSAAVEKLLEVEDE